MKDNGIKVSDELLSFIEEAKAIAIENRFSSISVELFVYVILKNYSENDGTDVECLSLKRMLNDLTDHTKSNMLSFCKEEYLRVGQQTKLPGTFSTSDILFSEELSASFRVASKGYNEALKKVEEQFTDLVRSHGEEYFRLGTMEIITTLLNLNTDLNMISELNNRFGVNGLRLISKIMSDGMSSSTPILNHKSVGKDNYVSELMERHIDGGEIIGSDEEEDKDNSGKKDKPEPSMTASTGAISSRKAKPNSKTPTLDQFATDMTEIAENGQYDPVVGREREIKELIEILCCRKKNNAILLGDPGCGKTAIVECLAQKIVNNEVPAELKGHRILSLSTTDLLSGTMYRGQAEERVVALCKELKEHREIILYMDEFHQATSENQTSISDMLKPALGRGELTMIASTTIAEFKKYVEKDGALKRRFQRVLVEEPNAESTLEILKQLAPKYAQFHHVKYTDEVLKNCVEWSDKYIYDRKSPDKAIDLMDTAGAHTKLDATGYRIDFENREKEIAELVKKKIELVEEEKFEDAVPVRDEIEAKRKELQDLQEKFNVDESVWPEVTSECVAKVISNLTNIPADKINNPEIVKLKGMKESLLAKVIGQDESIRTVSLSLSKSFLGLRDETKPIASLLFVGPTGVGKTLLCEEICKTIYGDKNALLRIDCGEYSQSHTVTKLIGAPASYVGYGEPGIFDQIRERPNSLVLFDEIEKMHPDIINTIFLNIMSTGMVKMSNGVDVSFRNCIVVFTGNVGTKELQLNGNGIGFGTLSKSEKRKMDVDIVMKAIKKQFRPEFINRLSNITIFNELDFEDMSKIFELELDKLKERLIKRGYNLSVSEELKNFIISETDTKYGARDLARGITKYVEDRICETMLEKDVSGLTTITVTKGDESSIVEFTK